MELKHKDDKVIQPVIAIRVQPVMWKNAATCAKPGEYDRANPINLAVPPTVFDKVVDGKPLKEHLEDAVLEHIHAIKPSSDQGIPGYTTVEGWELS